MMHAVFSQALCHNASIRSYHEIFKSEPLHFPGFWLAKYVWSSLLLASFISGWPGLLASSSFSVTGWTSSMCWRCSPTTWSWAWPTWRPGPGRTSRERESYRASWWTMSHTGQYGSILYSDIGGRAHAMNWVQWPNVVYTKLFYDNNVMYIFNKWWGHYKATSLFTCNRDVMIFFSFLWSVFWYRHLSWWRRRRTTSRGCCRCSGCSNLPGY